MRKLFIIVLVSLAVSVGGCVFRPVTQPTFTPTILLTATIAFTPELPNTITTVASLPTLTSTVAPTKTEIPTFAPIQLSTSTPSVSLDYQKNCLDINTTFSAESLSKGSILLSDLSELYTFDTQNNVLLPAGIHHSATINTSPNDKWIAHVIENNDQAEKYLEVRSIDGGQRWAIPYQENWYNLGYWLNDEQIVMSYWLDKDGTPDWQADSANIIVNFLTGQTQKLDFLSLDAFPVRGTSTYYDPTLTRVIYQRGATGQVIELVLWDLQNRQVLWQMEIGDQLWYIHPQWSPDGTHFAVGGPPRLYAPTFELFVVDKDGQASQLTHFKDAGFRKGEIYQPQWSPDQRYIAFWFEGSLSLFDAITGITTDYCLLAPDPISFRPYWSQDSKQLVFDYKKQGDDEFKVIAVDVQKNWAVEIAKGYTVIGWMATP